jgi:hypothetical protein
MEAPNAKVRSPMLAAPLVLLVLISGLLGTLLQVTALQGTEFYVGYTPDKGCSAVRPGDMTVYRIFTQCTTISKITGTPNDFVTMFSRGEDLSANSISGVAVSTRCSGVPSYQIATYVSNTTCDGVNQAFSAQTNEPLFDFPSYMCYQSRLGGALHFSCALPGNVTVISRSPTTRRPSRAPTSSPSTSMPSSSPSTSRPSLSPSKSPSSAPTTTPSSAPAEQLPTFAPAKTPVQQPTTTDTSAATGDSSANGLVIGAAVGGVSGLVVIAAIVFNVRRASKRRAAERKSEFFMLAASNPQFSDKLSEA